jgi:hypothetical protein
LSDDRASAGNRANAHNHVLASLPVQWDGRA